MQDSPLDIGAVSLFSYGWRRKRILKNTVEGVACEINYDHRLADDEPLEKMLESCEESKNV